MRSAIFSIGLLACGGLVAEGEPSPSVTEARVPDATLRTLAIEGLALSPPFDPNVHEYTTPTFDAGSVLARLPGIVAVPSSPAARVTIDGAPSARLVRGTHRYVVRVVAHDEQHESTYAVTSTVAAPPVHRFVATNAADNQQFGTSVALGGDMLVVGKHWDHSGASGIDGDPFAEPMKASSGSVFVYRRDASGAWQTKPTAYLKASDPTEYGHFGTSVALEGATLVVGAHKDSSLGAAAYVFRLTDGTWKEEAHLRPEGAAEYVAGSVGMSGSTIALGYPGQVEVFERSGSTWSRTHRLTPAPLAGCSMVPVAISGDTIAAACHGGSWASKAGTGAIVILRRASGGWIEEATLSSASPLDSFFGLPLALDGDTLVAAASADAGGGSGIGSDPKDVSQPFSGAAYVFHRVGTTWSMQAYIKAPRSRPDLRFGGSVAIRGDHVAVGSTEDASRASALDGDEADMSMPRSGAVFLYSRDGDQWTKDAFVKAPAPMISGAFGTSVAIGEGVLAIGAMFEFPDGGAAYVY